MLCPSQVPLLIERIGVTLRKAAIRWYQLCEIELFDQCWYMELSSYLVWYLVVTSQESFDPSLVTI